MLIALFGLSFIAMQAPSLDESREGLAYFGVRREDWQHPNGCGLNCAYWILNNFGIEVTIEELLQQANPTTNGISLEQLQAVIRSHGLDNSVVKYKGDHLNRLPVPFIAHLSEGHETHYVVVINTDSENVTYIDGGTANKYTIPHGRFERSWSGLAVIVNSARLKDWILYLCPFVCGALGLFLMFRRTIINRRPS